MNEKINRIMNTGSSEHTTDNRRFKRSLKPITTRLVGNFAKNLAVTAAFEAVSGSYGKYASMDKKKAAILIAKKIGSLALKSGIKVATDDLLTTHALRRYDDNGTRKKPQNGKNPSYLTSTDLIEFGTRTAIRIAPVMNLGIRFLVAKDRVTKDKERERFEKWGANILPEKVNNVIWKSSDGETQVLDGPIFLNNKRN